MSEPLAPISSRAADAARDAWDSFPALHTANAATRAMEPGNATAWGLSERARESTLPPISLGGGIPDAETQPRQELLAAMARVLDKPGDAPLVYGGPQGYEPLRHEIASYFARNHPAQPGTDWYLMTNGAAGAIESICAAFLDPGDVVITEIPTFAGSLRTMRGKQALGCRGWDGRRGAEAGRTGSDDRPARVRGPTGEADLHTADVP